MIEAASGAVSDQEVLVSNPEIPMSGQCPQQIILTPKLNAARRRRRMCAYLINCSAAGG